MAAFDSRWPISEIEYAGAVRTVRRELGFYEIIRTAHIISDTQIEFVTLQRWTGPLAAAGRTFVVERENGVWKIKSSVLWVS